MPFTAESAAKAREAKAAKEQQAAADAAELANLRARFAAQANETFVPEGDAPVATAQPSVQTAAYRAPTIRDKKLMGMNQKLPERVMVDSDELSKLRKAAREQGGDVVATSNEPPKYVQYDDWSIARMINANNYQEVMRGIDKDGHRLHDLCPNCGGEHPETEGNPNACPAREKLFAKKCPDCPKICWPDARAGQNDIGPASNDPYVEEVVMTDEMRKRSAQVNFEAHVGTYHPNTARILGIPINALAYGQQPAAVR